jgi:endonuclease YncB( thermonuclease family)
VTKEPVSSARGDRMEILPPIDRRSKTRSGKRVVTQCFLGARDVAAQMVRAGHARDWPKYSGGGYSQ